MGFKIGTFEFRPCPKPDFKREKPTAKQRGATSKAVYAAALARSGGRCERCGCVGELQCAHLIRRRLIKDKTTVNDVAMLCGPSVNTGTCHNWVDYTEEGREWGKAKRDYFYSLIEEGKD